MSYVTTFVYSTKMGEIDKLVFMLFMVTYLLFLAMAHEAIILLKFSHEFQIN